MMPRTRRLRLLRDHWAVLGEAFLVVAIARIGLTIASQDRTRRWVLPRANIFKERTATDPRPVAWAVRQAARLIPRASCLTQAIAGQAMLARRGLPANVRIGVRRGPTGAFEAHAWLIHRDVVMVGAVHEPGASFVTIADIGPSRP